MPEGSLDTGFQILSQVVVGLMGLSFLVLIHEAGHFLVAKKLGVRVHTFAIGFGKTLMGFRRGETEYCLKAIPFGGFVAMAGEQPSEERAGEPGDFSSQTVPARMAIALAGPAVNILFAFLALVVLYRAGTQEPISDEIPVGQVMADSPAEAAGIRTGDRVVALDGEKVSGPESFLQAVALEAGNPMRIDLRRGDERLTVEVVPVMHEMGFAWIGLIPGKTQVQVSSLLPGKPAEAAGFHEGDVLLRAADVPVTDANTFIKIVEASGGEPFAVTVLRDSVERVVRVTPRLDGGNYRIGMGIATIFNTPTHLVRRGWGSSVARSWEKNLEFSGMVFKMLSGLFQGQVKLKALSGPVGILQVIGNSFRNSLQKFIEFMALISLNLGLINLLPLVITDGGVILFLALEAVRRKPLAPNTQMRINQVAISLFIALALFITFHDILKIPLFLD